MPAPRKKKSAAPAADAAPRSRKLPRFRMVKGEDGLAHAERTRTLAQGARDQALADYLCACPELKVTANMRSVQSLLGEVLEAMHLEEETIRPEILASIWKKAVGDSLAAFTELQSVSKHTARVWVNHPAVRYELLRLTPKLIQALNAELGDGCVKKLKIVQ
mgnify:CR=1 FL=1